MASAQPMLREERNGSEKNEGMIGKCFDQESIVRPIKKKTNFVKTTFCLICRKEYVTKSKSLFLRHFSRHMNNMYDLPRFSCSVCEYATSNFDSIQSHVKAMHGKADCFTDEIGTWPPAKIQKVSKLCFGSEDLTFSRLPDKWHLKWKITSPETDPTMTTDTNTSTSGVQLNPSEMGTVKMELELEMNKEQKGRGEKETKNPIVIVTID